MLNQIAIYLLKRRAAKALLDYYEELDVVDCGMTLAEHMNPRLAEAKERFNKLMDELAAIDPDCPPQRL